MSDRFLRPGSDVVCDRASRICYKDGKVDKSDTQNVFGERAGDRADGLRDRIGTGRMFVPEQTSRATASAGYAWRTATRTVS